MSNYRSNFAKIILEICEEEGICCTPLSDYWAFLLKKDGKEQYIYGYQFAKNKAVSHSICSDKSTASEVLSLHQIPNVEHICCMSPVVMKYASPKGNWHVIEEMLDKYGCLVLKDNHGTGGDHVFLVTNQLEAEHAAQLIFSSSSSMAVSPYYDIAAEYRVILMNAQVKVIYSKIRPHVIGDGFSTLQELITQWENCHQKTVPADDRHTPNYKTVLPKDKIYPLQWKHNLGQGSTAKLVTDPLLIDSLSDLAIQTVNALDIEFASVDIISTDQGLLVLEVNSGVMMEYLSGENEAYRTIAKDIYHQAIEEGWD